MLDGGNDPVADFAQGDDGNDVLRVRVGDTLEGSAGNDLFRYENSGSAFAATLGGGTDTGTLVGFGDITSLSLSSVERLVTSDFVRLTRAQLGSFTTIGEASSTTAFLRLADAP